MHDRWNVKIFNSLVLSQISNCLQFYSTVCSSDNRNAENSVSTDLSELSLRDPTFVHKTPATENVLSASTDDGGIVFVYQI